MSLFSSVICCSVQCGYVAMVRGVGVGVGGPNKLSAYTIIHIATFSGSLKSAQLDCYRLTDLKLIVRTTATAVANPII